MNQKIKRIIVIGVIFGGIWGGLTLLFPKEKSTPPSPSLKITPTQTLEKTDMGEVEKIRAKLPVRIQDFSIVYFEESGHLGVTIFQGDLEEKKQEVYDWLEKEGVEEPEGLPIIWSATNWVVTE